jgi:tetratricopeptide (TPR) repeat protein
VALNKAHTSLWVKVLIFVIIVTLVSLFMVQGIFGVFALFQQNQQAGQSASVDPVAEINQKYQGQIDSLKAVATSNPTSYTAAVQLADSYFDWAQELSQPTQGQSQPTTTAMVAAFTEWQAAKAAFDTATKLTKTFDPATQTDRSYAAYASSDTTAAIQIAKTVTQKAPTFEQGWSHLGIFYEAKGDTQLAIAAYKHYLSLNPKNQQTAVQFVQGRLKSLGASVSTTSAP